MKKIIKCPLNKKTVILRKNIKLKGKECKQCEHYNSKKWYSYKGEVDVFCMYNELPMLKDVIKGNYKPKKSKWFNFNIKNIFRGKK